MKRLALLGLVSLLVTPVVAQERTVDQQFLLVWDSLRANILSIGDFQLQYPLGLADGLSGRWLRASAVGSADPAKPHVVEECETNGTRIDATDPLELVFTHRPGHEKSVTTTYTSIGGVNYAVSTPKDELYRSVGADKSEVPQKTFDGMVKRANGLATMLRPQPDVLMIIANYDVPVIYARCVIPAP